MMKGQVRPGVPGCTCHVLIERVWMRVDLLGGQGMVLVAERKGKLVQAWKASDAAVVLPEGHGQQTRHDNLHTAQTAGEMFRRGLIDDNDILSLFEIVADQRLQVFAQIQAGGRMLIEIVEGLPEWLLRG